MKDYLKDLLENQWSLQETMKIALMLDVEMDEAYAIAIKALIEAAFDTSNDLTVKEIEEAHEMCMKNDWLIVMEGNKLEK